VIDNKRTGRKRKLSDSNQQEFKKQFTNHPKKLESARRRGRWCARPRVSLGNVRRRILNPELPAVAQKTGLSSQKPRRSAAKADEDEQEAFHDELKKKSRGRWTPP